VGCAESRAWLRLRKQKALQMRAICDWELFANVGYLQKAYLLFFILIFLVPPFSPMGAICK